MTNNPEVSPATLEVGSVIYGWNAEPVTITGETRVNWLVGEGYYQHKVGKKAMREKGNCGSYHPSYFASKEDAEMRMFVRNNQYKIARAVEYSRDPKLVKAVAELIGYTEAVHEPK